MSILSVIIFREDSETGNRGAVSILGDYVKEEMNRQSMTQLDLEQRSGIPNATLSRILSGGVAEPRPSQIARIAKGLGLKFWSLMQRAGYTTETPDDPDEETRRLADVLTARPRVREIAQEAETLTPEEQDAVLAFIALTRQRRPQNRQKARRRKRFLPAQEEQ